MVNLEGANVGGGGKWVGQVNFSGGGGRGDLGGGGRGGGRAGGGGGACPPAPPCINRWQLLVRK